MKNKATLTLIELSVMLAVFALAAVLCVRVFLWAEDTSTAGAARDGALLQAQGAAEVLKAHGGALDEAAAVFGGTLTAQTWTVHYNAQWEQTAAPDAYVLIARPKAQTSDLRGMADICVLRGDVCLARMEIAWQEVNGGA